ncbi:MAG: hypothetical protein ACQESG_01400 [Nanobdellota archaeon]
MTGQIKRMIDELIERRAQGNTLLAQTTTTKLILKGIDVKSYKEDSPDDPEIMGRLRDVAREWGVSI